MAGLVKKAALVLAAALALSAWQARACTGIFLKGNAPLLAFNEDAPGGRPRIWFMPAGMQGNRFGLMMLGLEDGGPQFLMNEKGLTLDGFTVSARPVSGNPNLPDISVNDISWAIMDCETVAEVDSLWRSYNHPWMTFFQWLITDATGTSMILEPTAVIRSDTHYQICTNFYQSDNTGGYPCYRYNHIQAQFQQAGDSQLSDQWFWDRLNYCKQDITCYSALVRNRTGQVQLAMNGDFQNIRRFRLDEELEKGFRTMPMEQFMAEVTAVSEEGARPASLMLSQNWPNPFNGETEIQFQSDSGDEVRLLVYDVLGRCVRQLYTGRPGIGAQTVRWNGCDAAGRALPSGIYLCELRQGRERQVRKLHYVR